MRKHLLILLFIFATIVISQRVYAYNYVEVTSCGVTLSSNTYYYLTSDLYAESSSCFYGNYVGSENTIIDLNGHKIVLNNSHLLAYYGTSCAGLCSAKYLLIKNGTIETNSNKELFYDSLTPTFYKTWYLFLEDITFNSTSSLTPFEKSAFLMGYIYGYNLTLININFSFSQATAYSTRVNIINSSIGSKNTMCFDTFINSTISGYAAPCSEFDHIYKIPEYIINNKNSRIIFTDNYIHLFYVDGNDIIARRYAKDLSQYYEERAFSDIFGSVTPSIDNWDVAWRPEINRIVLAATSNYGTAVCFIDEEYDNVVCHTPFSYSTVTIGNVENSILSIVGYNQTSPPSIFITRFNVSSIPSPSVTVSELELPASYIQLFYKPYVLYNGTHYYLFTIANNNVPGYVGRRFLYLHIYDNDLNWVESKCAPAWNCYTEVHAFFAYEYPWTDDYGLVTINYYTHDIYRWVFTKKELFEEARSRLAIPFDPELITGPADYKSVERFSTYFPYFKYVEPEIAIPPYVTIYLIPEALYGNFSYSSVFAMTYEVGNNGGEDITVNVSVSNPTWMQIQSNMYMYKATINEYHPGWFVASIQPSGYVDFIVNFTVPKLSPAVIGHNVTEHIFASYDSSQISSLINVYIYGPSSLSCGNGICEPGESYINCPLDCYGNESFVCGNGICEPGESYDNCPIDCPISQYPSIPPTPPTPPTPPSPPAYNITQPLAGINVTALQVSGYGWLVPFLTPLFITIGGIIGVGAAVEYYIKTGGIAFCLTIIALSLGLWYLGFLPMVVAILITIMAGLFLWYLASRLVRR